MITTTIIVDATGPQGVKKQIPFKCWTEGCHIYCFLDIGENGIGLHEKAKDEDFLKEHRMIFFHCLVDTVLHEKEDLINDWLNDSLN